MQELSLQNKHWFESIEIKQRKYRSIYYRLWANIDKNLMSFLIGPRRVGKSVILKQILSNLISVNKIEPTQILYWEFSPSDTQSVLKVTLDQFLNTIRNPVKTTYLLLDEIQYIKNWEEVIKLVYDQKDEVKIVLTGSLSLSFKRRMQESLAGRFLPYYIYQLDFREYLDFTNNSALQGLESQNETRKSQIANYLTPQFNQFLHIGRYPATINLTPSETNQYLESIEYQTICQDTLNYFNVEKINVFQSLFNYYKSNSGSEVSFTKLASQIGGTSSETIAKYTDILELLRLIYIVPNTDNPLKVLNSNKKIYTNSSFTLSSRFVNLQDSLGLAVESYVLEILLQKYQKVAYFRERQKEVDFIIWQHQKIEQLNFSGLAFEVKYQKNIDSIRDTKNLIEISKKLNLIPEIYTKELKSKDQNGIFYNPICLL